MKRKEIKLIACDIDGTLIPYGESALPEELFALIDKLYEKGIHFMVASGRLGTSLQELFAPVRDKISFICGNGAIYREDGRNVFTQPFEKAYICEMLREFDKDGNLIPIIMGEDGFYVVITGTKEEKEAKRKRLWEILEENFTEVTDPACVPGDICKLGVYQEAIMTKEEIQKLRDRWTDAILVCGGGNWLDVTDKHTNKGTALQKILQLHGWERGNLMAFGDNENDREMLSLAKYSYVMHTGAQSAKKAASFECESVTQVLRELLNEF